jgi:hypothetical protein
MRLAAPKTSTTPSANENWFGFSAAVSTWPRFATKMPVAENSQAK